MMKERKYLLFLLLSQKVVLSGEFTNKNNSVKQLRSFEQQTLKKNGKE